MPQNKSKPIIVPSSSNSNSSENSSLVHKVQIIGTTFKPSALKILKGHTVEWIHNGSDTHLIGFHDGKEAVESPMLKQAGSSFKWVFNYT